MRELALVGFVFNQPFDLDWALRTVSLGWYEPDDALPVTIVDIDEATYHDWHSPAITLRGELAQLIEVVTRAEPSAVVVDIDLSGACDAPAKDERRLMASLAYRVVRLLIFPKRMEPGEDGIRERGGKPVRPSLRPPSKLEAHATSSPMATVRCAMGGMAGVPEGKPPSWLPAVSIQVVNALADAGVSSDRQNQARRPIAGLGTGIRAATAAGPRITGQPPPLRVMRTRCQKDAARSQIDRATSDCLGPRRVDRGDVQRFR
jgi:hypothetical protein